MTTWTAVTNNATSWGEPTKNETTTRYAIKLRQYYIQSMRFMAIQSYDSAYGIDIATMGDNRTTWS
jgi:hypothetical protein